MNIEKEELDRLICAKYIYRKGMNVFNQGGPFSAGLALLHFQDSVEMVLRIIAQHTKLPGIDAKTHFDKLIDVINEKSKGKKIDHQLVLSRMNKARVSFKHDGFEPNKKDVVEFSKNLNEFFPMVSQLFLDINFESISLADLIEHKRTENYIKKAEQFFDKEDYENAIKQSTIAFEIFYKHHTAFINDFSSLKGNASFGFVDHNENHEKINEWGREIEKAIIEQQTQLNIIVNGINLADYRRFKKYAPHVFLGSFADAGNINFDFKHPNETIKDFALFCYHFVIEAIFIMKEHKFLPSFPARYFSNVNYKVIKNCDVFVTPNISSEIIRQAIVGEILNTFYIIGFVDNKSNFVEISQDSDRAYVKTDSVELFNKEN